MSPPKIKSDSSEYAPLAQHVDDEDSIWTNEKRSFSTGDLQTLGPSTTSQLVPKLILYFSIAVALLSAVNVALLPFTLSRYQTYPFTEAELQDLPYGDARLGLDAAARMIPPPQIYHRAWPDRIARVSRRLKKAVYGQGNQVYITVEDSTIMRFPIPSEGANACSLSWQPPPEFSARMDDLTAEGDITEIEIWQLIAPSIASGPNVSPRIDDVDYDSLAYSTLPIHGELLGVLDLTAKPNSTTVEFSCPSKATSLTVEMKCQRVACHVSFLQIDVVPRFGFELLRRKQ